MTRCWKQIDYNTKTTCKDLEDFGEDVCSSYEKKCTDFLPSWLGWICKVTSLVCTGVTHIANWVCVAWNYLVATICVVVDVIVAGIAAVVSVLETVFGRVLGLLGLVLVAVFGIIPGIGPILNNIFNLFQTVIAAVISLPDAVMGLLGILPEKKMRVCCLVLVDSASTPTVTVAEAKTVLQNAADLFKEKANVRLICPTTYVAPLYNPFRGSETVTDEWVKVLTADPLSPTELSQSCNFNGFVRDLGVAGTTLERLRQINCASYASWRQWIGYGSPVTVMFISSFRNNKSGCCFPFSSIAFVKPYNTMNTPSYYVGAHEMGHACNLPHINELKSDASIDLGGGFRANLMFSTAPATDPQLYSWQVLLMRTSRHVTYL